MRRKFTYIFILAISLALCAHSAIAQDKKMSRQAALADLKKCPAIESETSCASNAIFLIKLYNRGERTLLTPLLDAGVKSDAALSEALGEFFAGVLEKRPLDFLSGLANRPKTKQATLALLAAAGDGSGNSKSWERKVKNSLKKIALKNRGRLALTAKICLREIDKYDANQRNQ